MSDSSGRLRYAVADRDTGERDLGAGGVACPDASCF